MLARWRYQRLPSLCQLDNRGRQTGSAAWTAGCGLLLADCYSTHPCCDTFISFPITFMGSSHDEAKRPASNNQDATSQATPSFKLKDGPLSVTVFARSKSKDEMHLFIVPERAYRNKDKEWVSTHILHQDDLLAMSQLLTKAYARLRHKHEETQADNKSQG